MKGVKIHKGVGCLKDLQSLMLVEANHHGLGLIKELGKLRQLWTLGISNIIAEHGRALCASIERMGHLKILVLSSISEDGILNLQSISSPPQFLEHIILRGRLEELSNWIPKLQNLVTLGLYFSGLEEDPLKYLLALPNLINLFLNQSYDGDELHFEEGGFQKLKKLTL
jgi:disease resistance protein RPM1